MAVVSTLAGSLTGAVAAFSDGTGSQAGFNQPRGVVVDASGNTYVADRLNHRVRKVTPGGGARMFAFIVFSDLKRMCTLLAMMCTSGILRVVDVLHLDLTVCFSVVVNASYFT